MLSLWPQYKYQCLSDLGGLKVSKPQPQDVSNAHQARPQ